MYRLVVFLVFALLTGAVNAHHHRGHFLMHIDDTLFWLNGSIAGAQNYSDGRAADGLSQSLFEEWQALSGDNEARGLWIIEQRSLYPEYDDIFDRMFHSNKYVIYAKKYLNRIEMARDVISTGGDPDEARRMLNAPGFGNELDSVLYGLSYVASIWLTVDDINMQNVHTKLRKARDSANWAHWHINDAIREEIYQDPDFICAGPKNHC